MFRQTPATPRLVARTRNATTAFALVSQSTEETPTNSADPNASSTTTVPRIELAFVTNALTLAWEPADRTRFATRTITSLCAAVLPECPETRSCFVASQEVYIS